MSWEVFLVAQATSCLRSCWLEGPLVHHKGCSNPFRLIPSNWQCSSAGAHLQNSSFFFNYYFGNPAGKHQRHPCGPPWLQREALAVEETPKQLSELSPVTPGQESCTPLLGRGQPCPAWAPCAVGQRVWETWGSGGVCPTRRRAGAVPIHQRPSGAPSPAGRRINHTVRDGGRWGCKGSARERKNQIKGRNSSEITELFIFPAASGDFFPPLRPPRPSGLLRLQAVCSSTASQHPIRHRAPCSLHHAAPLRAQRPFDLHLCCVYV